MKTRIFYSFFKEAGKKPAQKIIDSALSDQVANVKHQRYAYNMNYPPAYP